MTLPAVIHECEITSYRILLHRNTQVAFMVGQDWMNLPIRPPEKGHEKGPGKMSATMPPA